MDLFEQAAITKKNANAPLAARMRPTSLDDFIGQEKIVGKGCLLRRAIEADRLTSVIFYGPPGCGKTTLAQIIAQTTASNFRQISAVTAGIADIREVLKTAEDDLKH
ncbi:MAG: AAA family ATPase, partial [Clostridiales bacterium]